MTIPTPETTPGPTLETTEPTEPTEPANAPAPAPVVEDDALPARMYAVGASVGPIKVYEILSDAIAEYEARTTNPLYAASWIYEIEPLWGHDFSESDLSFDEFTRLAGVLTHYACHDAILFWLCGSYGEFAFEKSTTLFDTLNSIHVSRFVRPTPHDTRLFRVVRLVQMSVVDYTNATHTIKPE